MEKTRSHKHFDEEAVLNKAASTLDQKMAKLTDKWFAQKFIALSWIKKILTSKFVRDINIKIQPYLKTIFTVVGWISLVAWIIGVFSFLVSLTGIGFMFSLGFGIGLRVLLYVLLAFAFALISLLIGFGLLKQKKRVVSLSVLWLLVSAVTFLLSFIPVGLYSYKSYGSFGSTLLNLVITFVIFVLIVINERMFTK